MSYSSPPPSQLQNRRLALVLVTIVIAMGGLSFAAVPLYDLFCRVTGFGGTPQQVDEYNVEVLDRQMRVQFIARTDPHLDWHFSPMQRDVTLQIGAGQVVHYIAENLSDEPMAGMATFNVTPLKAGVYFHKIQCFCFIEQVLAPGEKIEMPVYFYLDPALAEDPSLDDVTVITLSYHMYPAQNADFDNQRNLSYYQQDAQ